MKRILLFILLLAFCQPVTAQSLKKYNIGSSKCAAYFLCNPGKFELSLSPDSSKVYTGECTTDGFTYDVICVQMKERIKVIADAEGVLEQYLDYLKSSFQVSTFAGYGKGLKLKGNENTRGIVDNWTDKDKNNINVKGWTDGKYIAVLMIISSTAIRETKANVFLDGIVFPAK